MGLTVNSRPNAWSAVKVPIIYKMLTIGGPFVNYRIEVEVFNSSTNVSLTSGIKFVFSPDQFNVTFIDISEIIKNYLLRNWSSIVSTSINAVEDISSLGVYIKYQEQYDGSAAAVQDDVANPFQCVFASLQIPSSVGNSLAAYLPATVASRGFLYTLTRPKAWRGYPLTMSYIFPPNSQMAVVREQQDINGATLSSIVRGLDSNGRLDGRVERLSFFNEYALLDNAKSVSALLKIIAATGAELLTNSSFVAALAPWINQGAGTNWAWAAGDKATVTTVSSKQLEQTLGAPLAIGWYMIAYNIQVSSDPTKICSFVVEAWNAGVFVQTLLTVYPPAGTNQFKTWTFPVYISVVCNSIRIRAAYTGGVATLFEMYSFSWKAALETIASQTQYVDIEDACDNAVTLFWKNSLCGDAQWCFDINQELAYRLESGKKAKRLLLMADSLSYEDWEMINELNSVNEIYRNALIELTSSVIKSHSQIDQQVYAVDAAGNKIGVTVIPRAAKTETKKVKHTIEIEIEMPEVL